MFKKYDSQDDVYHMILAYLVCIAVICLIGVYGCNFLMTIWLYNLPFWFTLECYLMLLAGQVCVTLFGVVFTAIVNTLILKESLWILRMLFPLCLTLIPLSLNLWIYHLGLESFYIYFSYECRYVIWGFILVQLFLLFGKIGPFKGLLNYPEDDNAQKCSLG